MAGRAGGSVVDGSEAGFARIAAVGLMVSLKDLLIEGEVVSRGLVEAIAYARRTVEAGSVEAGRRLDGRLLRDSGKYREQTRASRGRAHVT